MTQGIVSADDHIDLAYVPRDLWQSRVPARLRDRAPRVVDQPRPIWVREGKPWGTWGSKRADGRKVAFDQAGLPEEPEPGIWRATDARYRLQDMARDGVEAQVLYNFLDWSFTDQELKTACLAAFNSWVAEALCAAAPDRLIGLATLPSHEAGAAVAELERAARLGMRGAIFDVFGATKPLWDPEWERLWAAAAAMGLPISVHIGTGYHYLNQIPRDAAWRPASFASITCMQLDEILVAVVMCGILERHPGLKFVLGESGIGWIPFVLERLEFERENYRSMTPVMAPKTEPRELFQRQVYATFGDERLGVRLIPEIGADNVMWASDYPHGDGSFPNSAGVIERIFAGSDPEIRRKALGGNARALYRIA